MPTNSVRQDFAEWLATPPIEGMFVETLEFYSAAFTNSIAIANRVDSAITATGEDGVPRYYYPLAFTLSKPAIRNSTEMQVTARIDAIDGALYQTLCRMGADDLSHILYAVVRSFIYPTMLNRPVYMAPLRFRVETAKIGIDVIDVSLVSGRLPNKRAGLAYTIERFPGLRPF